ncbi:tetratricopeptide repeat-containing sulfotransferase family protein [Planctomycetes bacterium K23_9]|uniref:Tetratricopeptide repeat protein n=1 Tax=Stieleria marina TaxID=1930275 RepID=A0A517NQB2_9BACT|nr:tetratricopeptide repeat protein [Planctomycetes bacterium K23_9]
MQTSLRMEPRKLERLFAKLCDQSRSSSSQSHQSIVQQSKQRLGGKRFDAIAVNVVAANDLIRNRPEKSLQRLEQSSNDWIQNSDSSQIAGFACVLTKQFQQAHEHLSRCVKLDPHRPDCWTLLGKLSEQSGQESWAIEYYERAIVLDESSFDSAIALSQIYAKKNDLRSAIHTLRVCLLRDSRSAKLNIALARLLLRRAAILKRKRKHIQSVRLSHEALDCYCTANARAPHTRSLIAQGVLQQKLNQFHAAKESFTQALQREPQSASALTMLAISNVDCGDLSTAISLFRAALQIDPQRALTHFRYSRAQKFSEGTESRTYIASLRALLDQPDVKRSARVLLNFALAKVLEDTGSYDEAWHHYDQANRLKSALATSKSASPSVKAETASSRTSNKINAFTPASFHAFSSVGNSSDTPIFIVGMPRSGTTLTEQILSSHPSVSGAGELHLMDHVYHDMMQSRSVDTLREMTSECFRKAAEFYLQQIQPYRHGLQHITDKMPTNFMHLGLIATLFPNAKIIHCSRNPMDIFVSSYCQNLNAPFCDLEQLVDYYHNYRRLMHHWQSVLPTKIHTVQYESLTADPTRHSRDLIQHCGLEWAPECLDFHKNDRAVHTPSKWQVRQPMYRSSVEKWRRYEQQLQPIAEKVQAIRDEFDQ